MMIMNINSVWYMSILFVFGVRLIFSVSQFFMTLCYVTAWHYKVHKKQNAIFSSILSTTTTTLQYHFGMKIAF